MGEWSSVGGQVISAYVEGRWTDGADPSGSSSGSAVGVSAGFAAGALGGDTTGSVVSSAIPTIMRGCVQDRNGPY